MQAERGFQNRAEKLMYRRVQLLYFATNQVQIGHGARADPGTSGNHCLHHRLRGVSMETTIEELAPYLRGWRSYF